MASCGFGTTCTSQIWLILLIQYVATEEDSDNKYKPPHCLSLPPYTTKERWKKIDSCEWWCRIVLMKFMDFKWREHFQSTVWHTRHITHVFFIAPACTDSCSHQKLGYRLVLVSDTAIWFLHAYTQVHVNTLSAALSPTAELNNMCLYEKTVTGFLWSSMQTVEAPWTTSDLLLCFWFHSFCLQLCNLFRVKMLFFLFSPTCSLITPKTELILCIMQRREEKKSLSVVKEPCLKTHLHCSTSELSLWSHKSANASCWTGASRVCFNCSQRKRWMVKE